MQGLAVLFAIVAFFAGVSTIRAGHLTRFGACVDVLYFALLLSAIVWTVAR